jgi:hypothetical protein
LAEVGPGEEVGAGEPLGEAAGEVGEAEPAFVMMRAGEGLAAAELGFSGCFDGVAAKASVMVRLFGGFGEAGLEAWNCLSGEPSGGSGLGMGLDLTVRGAMFGREGAARSSTVFSSLGFGMGWPELVSISRGSAKETRAFFTSAAGVVGARFGVGGGRIDG